MYELTGDAVKTLVGIIICCSFAGVRGQEGNGCGHTLLGAESGTLGSQNYPGTYPSHTFCKWRLRVPEGRTLRLLFGDFDIESSPGCSNGSLVITDKNGYTSLGPVCGKLDASQRNVTLSSNEVVITFMSGAHRSGRGFVLSYATDLYPELISCLQRGSHFSSQYLSVYCPAGCKNVTGDVWGSFDQGYRDTSVLCKAAVHAGITADTVGGPVTVTRGRSLTLYESTFANGVLTKMGSLSEKKFLFNQDGNSILQISGSNASSVANSPELRKFWSLAARDFGHDFIYWTAENKDNFPWVELELSDRSIITGLITTVSQENYIDFYSLLFSKDKKSWKFYKDPLNKEKKVFQAYTDGHLRVLNSLVPSVVARFVRIVPTSWHGRASIQVQVIGCPVSKVSPRSRSNGESTSVKVNMATLPPSTDRNSTTEGPVLVETRLSSSQPVIVAVGVVLGLIMCGSCLMAGIWWKQRKKASQIKYTYPTVGSQKLQIKTVRCPHSEFISYPLERSVHDALPNPPLNDYAEPSGQKVGSTFRPSSDEGYTTSFALNLYDTPGNMPEYAEPLPSEPEYATPFADQISDSNLTTLVAAQTTVPAPASGCRTASHPAHYDCPSHKMLSNGYCTPVIHKNSPGPVNVLYAEPRSCDSLLQKPTYEQPL